MESIKVSSKFGPGTYINDAKVALSSKGSVELSALENGITVAIRAADALVSLGYAKLVKFETSILENDGEAGRFQGLTKVAIKLDKAPTFEQASKDYENLRAKR